MDLSRINFNLKPYFTLGKHFVKANSPAILTATAVVGVATTAIFAARGHHRAMIDIMHAESEMGRDIDLQEKVRLTWQYYLPPLTVGLATMGCIIGANTVHSKREAALMTAYTLSEKAFSEHKEKIKERFGENKANQVRDDINQDRLDNNPTKSNQVLITGSGDSLCYDAYTGRYFKSTYEAIRRAVNDLNAQINNDMYASQNDFNQYLGLPPTQFGDEFGWNSDNRLLDLAITGGLSDDGQPCLVLNYNIHPNKGFSRFGR